jgi:hypothetical protein
VNLLKEKCLVNFVTDYQPISGIYMSNYLFLTLFAFTFFSCSSSDNVLQPAGLMYNITLGEAGGITGMSEGYMIDTSGAVYKFRGKTVETAVKEVTGFLSSGAISDINKLITTIEEVEFRQSGNMYKFIILESNTRPDLNFAWSGMSKDPPQELEKFYHTITDLITNLKN